MIAIKGTKMPKGCQRCRFFRKKLFGNGLDYSYSCVLGATEFPMPWIKQMEERASDCPLLEIAKGHGGLIAKKDILSFLKCPDYENCNWKNCFECNRSRCININNVNCLVPIIEEDEESEE